MTNRVTELRNGQGWSQAQLADLLSVTRQTVIAIEQAKSDPSLATALRIAWLFRAPVESIFLADLDEQMTALNETWSHIKKTATALNEMGVLERMGDEGWEMTGFGAAALHFRRPQNASLQRRWEYKRVSGILSGASRAELEKQAWSFVGSWLGTFHYFKREARQVLSPAHPAKATASAS